MTILKSIRFGPGEVITNSGTIVAIGPNNGGKSQFLRDVVLSIAQPTVPRVAVQSVRLDNKGIRRVAKRIMSRPESVDSSGNYAFDALAPDLSSVSQVRPQRSFVDQLIQNNTTGNAGQLQNYVGSHLVAHLTTEQRLVLVKRRSNTNESVSGAQSPMHAAYEAGDVTIGKINAHISRTFGAKLILDRSQFAVAEFRLTRQLRSDPDASDRAQMANLLKLDDQGDGIRAFAGLVVSTGVIDRPIVAIDEPEAFLHPPQAYAIGQSIMAIKSAKRDLLVATHSAEVLRGMLTTADDFLVVRFTQNRHGSFARRKLDPKVLRGIANDPVLVSERILDGLFYNGVIVVESDGDAVIYRRVLEQMNRDGSFHFVNSYSKSASAKIVAPYQATGVPFAILVDFDAIRVPGELKLIAEGVGVDWKVLGPLHRELLDLIEQNDQPEDRIAGVKQALVEISVGLDAKEDARAKLRSARSSLTAVRDRATVWSDLKRHGRKALTSGAKSKFDSIDFLLRSAGIFVVPVGEREAWLPGKAPYRKNKNAWTTDALNALRSPLTASHPLRRFMRDVVNHLEN